MEWSGRGEAGETWHRMKFFVGVDTSHSLYIVLEAVLNGNDDDDLGHTAIDDILLLDSSCSASGSGE